MRVRGVGGWRICLHSACDVITLSRTMSHLWVNQTTATGNCLSSSVCDITPPNKNTDHLGNCTLQLYEPTSLHWSLWNEPKKHLGIKFIVKLREKVVVRTVDKRSRESFRRL